MADITKLNRTNRDSGVRYVIVKSTDTNDSGGAIAQGDIIRVETSLGAKGKKVTVATSPTCDLGIILNSKVMVYPKGDSLSDIGYMGGMEKMINVLANGHEADSENPEISIPGGSTMEFDGPISDIKIATWTTGSWEIRID